MPAEDLNPFPEIPGYRILAELGRGGMGIVYRAVDLKRHKPVALKTMQWVDPATLYRFKQEFRALAGLTHPHLVALYELVSDGKLWFFTMELIDGVDILHHVHAAGRLSAAAAAAAGPARPLAGAAHESLYATRPGLTSVQMTSLRDALKQLASGVVVLHDAGILHRDIKPANVLVTKQGRVILLDFGLAAEMDQEGEHQSTEPHLLGTVAYMSPEQAASQPVSPASDWYAVGVILYEALTGVLPFHGPTIEVLLSKQRCEPPAPSTLMPGVAADLNALAVDLLRRDPLARPSGREVLRRLGGTVAELRPADASPTLTGPHAPLIGRKKHLAALTDALLATRQGQTVFFHVRGRSGMGKSAVVRAFLDALAESDEAVVLSGRCYEQEAVPYKALDSLVDGLSRFLIRLSSLQAEALLPRDVLALARVFPVLRRVDAVAQAPPRPLDPTDAQEVRRRALAALRELLGRLGDRRPLVLFIDDLQWGDTDSAALLVDLLRPPESPTLLLLIAYRSEDAAASPCLKALIGAAADDCEATQPGDKAKGAEPPSVSSSLPCLAALPASGHGFDRREMAVEPLTPEEGRELALTLLDAAQPGAMAQAEAIVREAGGNPFFVLELVRHVQENRTIAGKLPDTAPPVTLSEVLWARVNRLAVAARRILEVVAVAGRPLRQTEACLAAGIVGQDLAALGELRTSRLVRSTGPAERDEIETYHNRVQETVVAHLTPDGLRKHHGELARVLGASGKADPERLAVHFQGAGDAAQAGKHYARAAAQATEALAFDRAAKLYRLALQLLADRGPEERSLRTRLGDALANAGRGGDAAREYLAAAEGADPAEALELRRKAALQFLSSGYVDAGLATLRTVLSAVGMAMPKTPRRAFWALVLRRMQLGLRGLGFRPRPADQVSPEDLSRINICWSASAGLTMVDTIQGAYFQTRGLLLALAAGEPYHLARGLAMQAGHIAIGGSRSRQQTARLLEAADGLAQRVDHPYPQGMVAMCKGIAAALEGRWRDALALCDQAEGIYRDSCTGVVWELDTAQRFSLWALMYLGRVGELTRRVPRLLKEAQERDDLYAVMNLSLVVGTFVRLAADEPDRARRDMEQVMALWPRHGFHVQHLDCIHDEAQIDLYQGKGQSAWDRLAERWPSVAGSHLFRVQQDRVFMGHLRARAALAAAVGAADPKPLLSAAEHDARHLHREKVPWAEALSWLIYAGVAMARRAPDAAALLRDAATALEAADMELYATAARRQLGRVVGGDEGQTLVAEADAWMKEQQIQNPPRFAAMLAPGLAE